MDDQNIQQDVNAILQKILGPTPAADTPTPPQPVPPQPPAPVPPVPPMPPAPPAPPQPPEPTMPTPVTMPPAPPMPVTPVVPVVPPPVVAPAPFPEPPVLATMPTPPVTTPVATQVAPPPAAMPPTPPAVPGSVFEGQGMGKYKVVVVKEKCIGAASCVAVASKAFKLNDQQIAEVLPTVNQETDDNLLLAAQSCPTLAIEVYDTTTGEKVWPK